MPFEKGNSGNSQGRPKGSKNKVNEELRELLEDVSLEAIQKLDINDLTTTENIKLLGTCLNYVMPKLKQMELKQAEDDHFKPIQINFTKRPGE